MSEEQLKAFLKAVKTDAGLQEKLKVAADADFLNYDYAKFGGYLDKTVVGIPLLPA